MKAFFTPLFLVLLCQSSMQDGHAMDDTAEAAKDRDWTFHAPSMNFFGSGEVLKPGWHPDHPSVIFKHNWFPAPKNFLTSYSHVVLIWLIL